MEFNIKKCKIRKIVGKKQSFTSTFYLNNIELGEVDKFRDLGVITDHHLRWNCYVNCVVAKVNKMFGLIKRTCKGLKNQGSFFIINLYSIFDFFINYERTALQIFFYFVGTFFGS